MYLKLLISKVSQPTECYILVIIHTKIAKKLLTFAQKCVNLHLIRSNTMQITEQEIIQGLTEGTESAYRYVFDHYYVSMCVLANSILHDEFLAQAAVSDVISHIYEIRHDLVIHTNVKSYLMRSVRNHCLNLVGNKVSRTEQTFSALQEDDVRLILSGTDNVTPQGKLLDNELQTMMQDFIDTIPEPTRTTFIKSRFQEMTYRQIGAEMGVSANTVKVRIQNALKMIQDHFGRYLTALTFFMIQF